MADAADGLRTAMYALPIQRRCHIVYLCIGMLNWLLIIISGETPIAVNTPRGEPYQRTTLLYYLLSAFGSLSVPPHPLFGRHLEQRIYNEDNNKEVTVVAINE